MKLQADNSPKSIKEQFWIKLEDKIIDVDFDLRVVEEFPPKWKELAREVCVWSLAVSDKKPGKVIIAGFPKEGGSFHHVVKQMRVIRHEKYGGILEIMVMDAYRSIWKCDPNLVASSLQFELNMLYYDYPRSLLSMEVISAEASQIETPEPLQEYKCSHDCGECIYALDESLVDLKPGESAPVTCCKTDELVEVTITRIK